jgi:hypothetical protein
MEVQADLVPPKEIKTLCAMGRIQKLRCENEPKFASFTKCFEQSPLRP